MVVLAKALSGGLVPVGAVLMSDAVYDSVYTSFKRAIVHTSTYSENGLAMRAGMAALDVLEEEELGARALRLGATLRERLRTRLAPYSMIKDVRGLGLLSGIEFQPPRELRLKVPYRAFAGIHPAMFGQVLVMRLFRDRGIYSQICGNAFLVLKASPALERRARPSSTTYVDGLEAIVALMHGSLSVLGRGARHGAAGARCHLREWSWRDCVAWWCWRRARPQRRPPRRARRPPRRRRAPHWIRRSTR